MSLPMGSGSGPSVGSQMAFDSPRSLTHHRPELGSALLQSWESGRVGLSFFFFFVSLKGFLLVLRARLEMVN